MLTATPRRPRVPGVLLGLALLPMVIIALFVAVLIWTGFTKGLAGTSTLSYTLENYSSLFGDPFFYSVLLNTLQFAAVTVVVALAIGVPIGWLVERTSMHGKTAVYCIMTLGLLVPPIYTAMGWTFIGHPRIGLLNQLIMQAFGLNDPPINVATPLGMGFVQGLGLASLGFILSAQMFRAMNPSLEEAARVHGMKLGRVLWKVTLPLALPGILAAVIYILTIALATFDIPAVLGLGNRVYMLSTHVYELLHPPGEGTPRYGISAALGALMILVALGLTAWYAQVLRQSSRYQVVTGKGYRPTPVKLGRWEVAAWAFVVLYALAAALLPLLMLAFVAFTPFLMPPSAEAFGKLTLANYTKLNWELVFRGLRNTLTLVLAVPVAVMIFAFSTSWLVVRSRSRARYVLDFGAFLPHALPELIMAVSAFLFALFVVGRALPLFGSVWLIAIVYIVARLAFATRAMNAALLQIHRELEEAAVASGLSVVRASWRVLLPLLRPTLFSVWLWTALLVYRELTAAVFLSSESNITLQAVIWSFWMSSARGQAAAVTLLVTAVMMPLMVVFWWIGRRSAILGNA
ncbi:MAG TPA: iron ABC transporter permease [Chloroflexota bacterium]